MTKNDQPFSNNTLIRVVAKILLNKEWAAVSATSPKSILTQPLKKKDIEGYVKCLPKYSYNV